MDWQQQRRLQYEQEKAAKEQQARQQQLEAIRQQAEGLKRMDAQRQAAQDAARTELQARIEQAYQGWDAIPPDLFTKSQLSRNGLHLLSGAQPVAEVYARRPGQRGYAFYDLYNRTDARAEAVRSAHEEEPRGYTQERKTPL